jgi:hypothetical protein
MGPERTWQLRISGNLEADAAPASLRKSRRDVIPYSTDQQIRFLLGFNLMAIELALLLESTNSGG